MNPTEFWCFLTEERERNIWVLNRMVEAKGDSCCVAYLTHTK